MRAPSRLGPAYGRYRLARRLFEIAYLRGTRRRPSGRTRPTKCLAERVLPPRSGGRCESRTQGALASSTAENAGSHVCPDADAWLRARSVEPSPNTMTSAAAALGALGALGAILGRTRAVVAIGLTALGAAGLLFTRGLLPGGVSEQLGSATGISALALGLPLLAALAAVFVRYPGGVIPAVVAAAPFRFPFEVGTDNRFSHRPRREGRARPTYPALRDRHRCRARACLAAGPGRPGDGVAVRVRRAGRTVRGAHVPLDLLVLR